MRAGEEKVVPPERVELSSPAPEAGTLSTELQGHSTAKNSMVSEGPTRFRTVPPCARSTLLPVDKPHTHP